MNSFINVSKIGKALLWAETLKKPDYHLDDAIEDIEGDIHNLKVTIKSLRETQKHLQLKAELNFDCINESLSVRCDGKTVSINVFNLTQESRMRLKKLGFSWSKDKLEFVRKVSGINVDAVKEFIKGNV